MDSGGLGRSSKSGLVRVSIPRILAIDDDENVLRHWARLLEGIATIVPAKTYAAGLAHIGGADGTRWRAEAYPFVFLDLRLPDGDGFDLLPRLADLVPQPQVAVLTGWLDANLAVRLHGACTIAAHKPADRETLVGLLGVLRDAAQGEQTLGRFARVHRLSPQETKLLTLAIQEIPNKQVADELGCGECTVRTYWHRIFAKTRCTNQRDVVARLFRFAEGGEAAGPEPLKLPTAKIGA